MRREIRRTPRRAARLGGLLLLALLLSACARGAAPPAGTEQGAPPAGVSGTGSLSGYIPPALGAASAPVTIVEFSDYQ